MPNFWGSLGIDVRRSNDDGLVDGLTNWFGLDWIKTRDNFESVNEMKQISSSPLAEGQHVDQKITAYYDGDDDSGVDSQDISEILGRQSLPNQKLTMFNGFWCCLVAICLLLVADSSFVEVPNNMVVLKWKSFETINMACKSNCQCNLVWSVRKNHYSEEEPLYNGYHLRPDAKSYCTVIADEPGKCYLNLTNTGEAAQTYICLDPSSLHEVSADLIWLGDLICNDSSTKDLLKLMCSVEFRGNWAPTMEWKEYSSHGDKVLSVGVNNDTVPNQRVTSTLVMELQNGSRYYTCKTKFDISGKPPHTTAKNIPEYAYSKIVRQQDELDSPTKCNENNQPLILGLTLGVIMPLVILIICTCCCLYNK